MGYERKCKICRKLFTAENPNTKYCSPKCKQIGDIETDIKSYERRKGKITNKDYRLPIIELNAEARAHGMSYGQWVAMKKLGRC